MCAPSLKRAPDQIRYGCRNTNLGKSAQSAQYKKSLLPYEGIRLLRFWRAFGGFRGIDRLKSRYLGDRAPITLTTL